MIECELFYAVCAGSFVEEVSGESGPYAVDPIYNPQLGGYRYVIAYLGFFADESNELVCSELGLY